jgi:hypothetical protein
VTPLPTEPTEERGGPRDQGRGGGRTGKIPPGTYRAKIDGPHDGVRVDVPVPCPYGDCDHYLILDVEDRRS